MNSFLLHENIYGKKFLFSISLFLAGYRLDIIKVEEKYNNAMFGRFEGEESREE